MRSKRPNDDVTIWTNEVIKAIVWGIPYVRVILGLRYTHGNMKHDQNLE